MPTYDYKCHTCGDEFETFQSIKDDALKVCTCGKKGKVERMIGTGAGIIFKGSGFYETDYKRSSSAGGKSESKSESSNGTKESRSESKPASESKATAKSET